jgi:hypothetical protein
VANDGASRVSRLLSTHPRSTLPSHPVLDSPLFYHPAFLAFCTASFACPHPSHHDRGLEGENMLEQLGSLSEATSQPCDICTPEPDWLSLVNVIRNPPSTLSLEWVQRQREASGGCAGLHCSLSSPAGITSSLLVNARNVTLFAFNT